MSRVIASQPGAEHELFVERLYEFTDDDLHALCEATDAAIIDGGGFGWVHPPGRRALESYYRGVLLVPERELFVARLDGTVVGWLTQCGRLVIMKPRHSPRI